MGSALIRAMPVDAHQIAPCRRPVGVVHHDVEVGLDIRWLDVGRVPTAADRDRAEHRSRKTVWRSPELQSQKIPPVFPAVADAICKGPDQMHAQPTDLSVRDIRAGVGIWE